MAGLLEKLAIVATVLYTEFGNKLPLAFESSFQFISCNEILILKKWKFSFFNKLQVTCEIEHSASSVK